MRSEQWLFFDSALQSDWCDEFVSHCTKTYQPTDALIGFDSETQKSKHRETEIRWLNPSLERELVDILWYYINQANRESFDVDVRYINELQFTSYHGKNKGHYGWHHDVDFKNSKPYHRKLSLTIQLTDPKEYKGGEFQFDTDIDTLPIEHKNKGTILIFPSFYRHSVSPVTKGTRHSLVTWVEGPHWR